MKLSIKHRLHKTARAPARILKAQGSASRPEPFDRAVLAP